MELFHALFLPLIMEKFQESTIMMVVCNSMLMLLLTDSSLLAALFNSDTMIFILIKLIPPLELLKEAQLSILLEEVSTIHQLRE